MYLVSNMALFWGICMLSRFLAVCFYTWDMLNRVRRHGCEKHAHKGTLFWGFHQGSPLHSPWNWQNVYYNPHGTHGCFRKWWYPTTMGFPANNDHFGVLWGYHHLRKHPYIIILIKNEGWKNTLQGTKISPTDRPRFWVDDFPAFPRWAMLVSWGLYPWNLTYRYLK